MDCHEVSELLSAYIDGELDPVESRKITSHLNVCVHCRQELSELQQTIQFLHELPDLTPPTDFCLRVMNKIKAEPKKRPWYAFKAKQWFSLGAVAAALLLFVVSANVISPLNNLPMVTETKTDMAAESLLKSEERKPETESLQILADKEPSDQKDEQLEGTEQSQTNEEKVINDPTAATDLKELEIRSSLEQKNKLSSPKNQLLDTNMASEADMIESKSQDSNGTNTISGLPHDYNSNGDKNLKNRGTNYRDRKESQVAVTQDEEEVSTAFDYNISLCSEDSEQASEEICQLVYSLGGNVLSDSSDLLEIAVPTERLDVAFAALKDQGNAKVRQVSSQDVNQTIKYLQQLQESLQLKIKGLERKMAGELSEEEMAELEAKLNRYYSDLKMTQMRLKFIANGNAIVKIFFEQR